MNTTAQQIQATGNKPAPSQEATIPIINATHPASGDCVVSTIAGNVITAKVTYGT